MKYRIVILAIVVFFSGKSSVDAQFTLNSVSVHVGTIRTLFPDVGLFEGYLYAFYPEIQIGGALPSPGLRWTVFWGYWNDGVDKTLPVADMVTTSYRSHILGTRIIAIPSEFLKEWPIPVGFFAGISHHFISARYVGGFDDVGAPGSDFNRSLNTIELGLNAEIRIVDRFRLQAEVGQYIPLNGDEIGGFQKNRRSYTIGMGYSF